MERRCLTLANVSVAPIPLADVIVAAGAAGFDAISVLGRSRRKARERAGWRDETLRALAQDHGVEISDVEAAGDWLSPRATDAPPWLDVVYGWQEYVEIAAALGATNLVALHAGT